MEGVCMEYYLAIDIGASSGRHIIGYLNDGKIICEEVYRFKNALINKHNHKCWDIDYLFNQVLMGLKKCKELNKIPKTIGIDTWAVDYVLIDEEGNRIGDSISYRDNRTNGIDKEVYKVIDEKSLYQRTGIQKQNFNTIYQLMADKDNLNKATCMFMIPDYLNYLLTGIKAQEYTNATTTQLICPDTKAWDFELIDKLGFPRKIFLPINKPGTIINTLKKEVIDIVGFNTTVVSIASHDTASAVIAVPSLKKHPLYISSGTWSLMGTELEDVNVSLLSHKYNLTNEGGFNYRYRFLKNIMGLWMIQSVQKEDDNNYSFSQLCEMAEKSNNNSIIDVNDSRFLAPKSMINEIKEYCKEKDLDIPKSIGDISRIIYRSLALSYKKTIEEIEEITGLEFDEINIIGGGSNAEYLNKLTKEICGRKVITGPSEATAIGNISCQMLKMGLFKNLLEARTCIYKSFQIKEESC